MPSKPKKRRNNGASRLLLTAFIGAAVFFSYSALGARPGVLSAVIVHQKTAPWVVLDEQDIESGATVPTHTNVVLHLPFSFTQIGREILLGQKGKHVRYWGYCFPQNYEPGIVSTRDGFPGQMFLSEKERAVRADLAKAKAPQFSAIHLPTKEQVQKLSARQVGTIRHQIELFKPGMLCYMMSEASLAIGLDPDGDGLNSKLEAQIGTDPANPDTDGDGISDGTEYLTGTSPLLRDTDGDGIIDGIEDKNWNGHIDAGESDPRTRDTDRDGLCDGFCRIRLANGQEIFAGEDRNLNGQVDEGETDPLKWDSFGDGYSDYQRFIQCLLETTRTDC